MANTTTTTATRRAPAKKAAAPADEVDGNRATRRAQAKKTAAKKTAAKKTSTAQAKKATADRARTPNTVELTFHGRTMTVARPDPEQLAMWQLYSERLQSLGAEKKPDGQTMVRMLGRVVKLIQALLPGDADKLWIEDQLLDHHLTMVQVAELVPLAAKKFQAAATAAAPPGSANAAGKSRARRG